jgi:hypothetical protein
MIYSIQIMLAWGIDARSDFNGQLVAPNAGLLFAS